jgi:geranylgeranyl transferase type-1 subunit beta
MDSGEAHKHEAVGKGADKGPDFATTIRFLKYCANVLPSKYEAQEVNRLTLAYFVINALNLLGQLHVVERATTIDWIYSLQVVPDAADPERNAHNFGFRGSPFYGTKFNPQCHSLGPVADHDQGHLAMDYCALSLLKVLGDDLGRVNAKALLKGVRLLQQKDGSFSPVSGGSENDMRFVYCAAAVCSMLQDFSGMDTELATAFIKSSQRYDGGFSQGGTRESHGGSTYCAVAALSLMGRLNGETIDIGALTEWLSARQTSGFQGRVNKVPDSCYGFWCGASLKLLGKFDEVVERGNLCGFVRSCCGPHGGFGKHADANPDVLHTYYSLCALSMCGTPGLAAVNPQLGISLP